MILVPLPFVVSLFLLTILVQAIRRDEDGLRANPLFVALIAAYAIQSVLVGLRWGYDLREVLPLMSPLATLIAPLAWARFQSLTREAPTPIATLWPHLLSAAAVVSLMALWPDPVGAVIVAVFAGYGIALLWVSAPTALWRHGSMASCAPIAPCRSPAPRCWPRPRPTFSSAWMPFGAGERIRER